MPPVLRVSIRKKRGFRIGRRIVTCEVGPDKEQFAVHENLLCKNSVFFRNAIQPNRRAVEGDCSICFEQLEPDDEDLTHCRASCGGNFHCACFEEWRQQATTTPRCPLCRSRWKEPPPQTQSLDNVSERGFETYVEWLYRAKILVSDDEADNNFNNLVEAYGVGMYLDDQVFCNAILQSIIEVSIDEDEYPSTSIVDLAYGSTDGPCSLNDLLVGLFTRSEDDEGGSRLDDWGELPAEFLYDCATTLMRQVPVVKKEWTLDALTADLLPGTRTTTS